MSFMLATCLEEKINLAPEVEEGNIEYKLKLSPANEERLKHLASQLKWRLTEHGECHYFIGVDDDGTIRGIPSREMDQSLQVLESMCQTVGARVANNDRRRTCRFPELYAAQVTIVRLEGNPEDVHPHAKRAVKVAFVGDSGSGKSTLAAALLTGDRDNGCGALRLSLLRHRHEVLSGRTSSVAVEFLPFDNNTRMPLRLPPSEALEPVPLAQQKQILDAERLIQMVDLAGDQRYQKTTYSALTSWAAADFVCLCVSAPSISGMEDEKYTLSPSSLDTLTLIIGLELPFFIVVTKCDLVETRHLNNMRTVILDQIVAVKRTLLAVQLPPSAVSLYQVSAVDGDGINNLASNFYRLRQRRNLHLANFLQDQFPEANAFFCVEGAQHVPDVGIVLSGTLAHGALSLTEGSSSALFGPLNGHFIKVRVNSMQRMRLPVRTASAGQMVTLAVSTDDPYFNLDNICKGSMVILGMDRCDHPIPLLDHIEADVIIHGITPDQVPSIDEPIQGILYYSGNRLAAQLISLSAFYLEVRLRAMFKLIDCATLVLPATRLIFSASSGNLRLQGRISWDQHQYQQNSSATTP